MNPQTGKYLILLGIAIVVIGLFIYFLGDKLNWFGKLPGDIRVEKENFRFYFPLTSMILLGLLFNLIIILVRKFL